MGLKKLIKNERGGVATVEFLSLLPLILFVMMVCFQFLVAGYAVIITQSAANEAAKTYSVTNSSESATAAAQKIISTAGQNLQLKNVAIQGGTDFDVEVSVDMSLLFVPEKYTGVLPKIPFSKSISGRVMN